MDGENERRGAPLGPFIRSNPRQTTQEHLPLLAGKKPIVYTQ
jgi:hypothetical protein